MGNPTTKKPRTARKDSRRAVKGRRHTEKKHIDEIDDDIKEENIHKLLHQEVDHDKPGCGQSYCVHCGRYFIHKEAMLGHFKTKGHKRRLKDLELEPHTQAEADLAAGFGSFVGPKRRKIETQPIDDGKFDKSKEDVDLG